MKEKIKEKEILDEIACAIKEVFVGKVEVQDKALILSIFGQRFLIAVKEIN